MPRFLPALTTVALATCLFASCGNPKQEKGTITFSSYNRAVALLISQSKSEDPSVRANCIEALQLSHDPRVVDVIEQGLRDKEWVVRFASCMAAGKHKAIEVRPVVATLGITDPNGSVRAGAIYAMHRMGDSSHVSDLATLLRSPSPSTRANAALVLGMIGDRSAIPLLHSLKSEEDIRVRFEVTAALARLGDEAAQKIICSWAVNRYAEDQWQAMTVCADLPKSVALSPLLLGLEGVPAKTPQANEARDLIVRRQLVAARSLAILKDGAGAKIAVENLKNPEPSLRALAALALGEMLTQEQAPGLEPLLADPDEGVQRAAAAAVVNIVVRTGAS